MTALSWSAKSSPNNAPLEQGLLGAIIINAKTYFQVADFLKPLHFADPTNGKIFEEQGRLIVAGGVGDAVTLSASFANSGILDEVGGNQYLARLISAYVGPGTAVPYAKSIMEAWQRRELIGIGEELVEAAFMGTQALDAMVSRAMGSIEATLRSETERAAVTLDQAMDAAIQYMDDARRGDGEPRLSTGFPSIDERMGGLESDSLTVIAGRPGMGKSSLGAQIAVNVARQGVGVAVISLEMSAKAVGRRILSAISGVPIWVMRTGKVSNEHGIALVKARRELANLPMTIEDGGGLTVQQIDLKVRAAHRRHGVGLIMVDHLHIVRPDDNDARHGPTWAVGRISGAMKRMAKAHNCPLVLLAQLSRGVEGRDDKRPVLADLRQAGDIEQDADAVGFVYRPEYYLKAEPERSENETPDRHASRVDDFRRRKSELAGKAEVIFAKVRDGETGTVDLIFTGDTASFSEVEGER